MIIRIIITIGVLIAVYSANLIAQKSTIYQLEIKHSILPYYLILQDSSFYFFEYKEEQAILCNYGKYQLDETNQPHFIPVINPEGYTVTWSYYGEDSTLHCGHKDSTSYQENNIQYLDPFECISNIAGLSTVGQFERNVCDLFSLEINHQFYSTIGSIRSTTTDYYRPIQHQNFQIKAQSVPIQSPVISLQDTTAPHLIIAKMIYPRAQNPYHYYFFPKANSWTWITSDHQVLEANCVSVLTFFDFKKGSFQKYFDSKHGVYTACQWQFKSTKIFENEKLSLVEELQRQIRILDYHKIPFNDLCSPMNQTVVIRKYPNPPIQDFRLVQKNSKKQKWKAKFR
jgi:hypothetical protein